jgi:hypothetical protein
MMETPTLFGSLGACVGGTLHEWDASGLSMNENMLRGWYVILTSL